MSNEQILNIIKKSFAELKSTIAESVQQLFNNAVQLELVQEDFDLSKAFEEKGQHVCVYFKTIASTYIFGHLFLLSPEFAAQLYAWMIGAEPEGELNEEHLEGLKEATDQIFGRVKMTITSDDAPAIEDIQILQVKTIDELSNFIDNQKGNNSKIKIEFSDKSFEMVHHFVPVEYAEEESGTEEGGEDSEVVTTDATDAVDVQPAEFEKLAGKSMQNLSSKNIDMLMDVELEVSVELGKKTVLISDVLKLGKGSILELEKSAGENLDIIVNGKKLAEGEVVVIDEHFGIRITQLISPKDRVQLLQ